MSTLCLQEYPGEQDGVGSELLGVSRTHERVRPQLLLVIQGSGRLVLDGERAMRTDYRGLDWF